MSNLEYDVSLFAQLIRQQMRGFSILTMLLMGFTGILFLFLYLFIMNRVTGKAICKSDIIWKLGLIIYACFIFQITIYRRDPGTRNLIRTDLDFGSLSGNFMAEQQFVYCVLNMLLFMPWGFLIAAHRKDHSKIKKAVMVFLCSFLTSFLIEVTQLITKTGYFELNDIILNLSGGELGGLLYIALEMIARRIMNKR